MHQRNIGIVLRVNYSDNTVVLFDKELGKIKAFMSVFKNQNKSINWICNGALIEFELNNNRLKSLNILDVPFSIALNNILFFHHILELYYYSIPLNLKNKDLFDLIHFIFFSYNKSIDLITQKIILVKFLLLTGLYPEEDDEIKSFFFQIMTMPIDRITDTAINLKNENEINSWILKTINLHPYFSSFKTINFLKKIVV